MAFLDRSDAGRRLADKLGQMFTGTTIRRAVVEGMARGGIPVAFEIARSLRLPLDVVVVRKLGHPRQPELGLGAIGEDGVRVVNATLIDQLQVEDAVLDAVASRESAAPRGRGR